MEVYGNGGDFTFWHHKGATIDQFHNSSFLPHGISLLFIKASAGFRSNHPSVAMHKNNDITSSVRFFLDELPSDLDVRIEVVKWWFGPETDQVKPLHFVTGGLELTRNRIETR